MITKVYGLASGHGLLKYFKCDYTDYQIQELERWLREAVSLHGRFSQCFSPAITLSLKVEPGVEKGCAIVSGPLAQIDCLFREISQAIKSGKSL